LIEIYIKKKQFVNMKKLLTEKVCKEIENLFYENFKNKEIAIKLKISQASVSKTLKALGLAKNKKQTEKKAIKPSNKATLKQKKPKTKIIKNNKEIDLFSFKSFIHLLETESHKKTEAIETQKNKMVDSLNTILEGHNKAINELNSLIDLIKKI